MSFVKDIEAGAEAGALAGPEGEVAGGIVGGLVGAYQTLRNRFSGSEEEKHPLLTPAQEAALRPRGAVRDRATLAPSEAIPRVPLQQSGGQRYGTGIRQRNVPGRGRGVYNEPTPDTQQEAVNAAIQRAEQRARQNQATRQHLFRPPTVKQAATAAAAGVAVAGTAVVGMSGEEVKTSHLPDENAGGKPAQRSPPNRPDTGTSGNTGSTIAVPDSTENSPKPYVYVAGTVVSGFPSEGSAQVDPRYVGNYRLPVFGRHNYVDWTKYTENNAAAAQY